MTKNLDVGVDKVLQIYSSSLIQLATTLNILSAVMVILVVAGGDVVEAARTAV